MATVELEPEALDSIAVFQPLSHRDTTKSENYRLGYPRPYKWTLETLDEV